MMPARPTLLRGALAAVALTAIVWSLVLARDAHLQTSALAAANARPTPATFRASAQALRGATRWSAATAPKIYLAGIELLLGRARQALALADQVVKDEPLNLTGWRMVALAGARAAPAQARLARGRIAALDPVDARR